MLHAPSFTRLWQALARRIPATRPMGVRQRLLGTALALLAAGHGAPVRGMFSPGTILTLHTAGSMEPIAAASFSDDGLFVLDSRPFCAQCVPGLDSCDHHPFARLLHLQRVPGADSWQAEEISGYLPMDAEGLAAGPDSTLVLSLADGSLRLLKLSRREAGWHVSLDYHLLQASQFADLGLPGRWHTFAVAPDGGIILGFERSVARLLKGGAKRKGDVKWLYGAEPGPVESKEKTPGAAMLVAADGHGRVWVVDAAARTAFRIDPQTLKVKPLARPESWPSGFTPHDIAVSGRHLFVSGMPAGSGGWPTQLLVLTPEGKVQAAARQTIEHKFSFTATPGGHVALCDWENGRVRLLPNLQAEPPAKGERKSVSGPVAGDKAPAAEAKQLLPDG